MNIYLMIRAIIIIVICAGIVCATGYYMIKYISSDDHRQIVSYDSDYYIQMAKDTLNTSEWYAINADYDKTIFVGFSQFTKNDISVSVYEFNVTDTQNKLHTAKVLFSHGTVYQDVYIDGNKTKKIVY